jgi:hypothetical protein
LQIRLLQSSCIFHWKWKTGKILKTHDELAANSPFNVADSFQFGLERERIEWEYAPLIKGWNLTIRLWEKMLMNVYDWLDSFGSFCTL